MGRLDEIVETYLAENKKLKMGIKEDLLVAVTKKMGPSIYSRDASIVAASDPKELETIKKNFLIKKLGMKDTPALDDAIQEAIEAMGRSNRNKYRALMYAYLVQKYRKSSLYK